MDIHPVRVRARPDAPGRWLWLVKWLLLVPHYLVLAVLWVAFVVLTLVAYVAVLLTGRYPHAISVFNVGVLRWTWRVGYYGYWVLGTDRYPPFTLADVPDYPAQLDLTYTERPRRWLPLVAWLFALPHGLILAGLIGGAGWTAAESGETWFQPPIGVVAVGILVVGVTLAVTGRHPRGLFDLLVGVFRWWVRTAAYVAVLTDRYPPFRLDQGGEEPTGPLDDPAAALPYPAGAAPHPPAGNPGVAGTVGLVVALIAGVLLLAPATGLAAGGAAILAINGDRGRDGYLSSETLMVTTATAALTTEAIEIRDPDAVVRSVSGLGDVRITAASRNGKPLFVGVAPESDVDAWLAGTAHDEVDGPYSGGQPRYSRAPGGVSGVGPPGQQRFWLASATGTTAVLNWTIADGRFAVVLANADGSPAVDAAVVVATRLPDLAPLGIGLLAAGGLLALVAIGLICLGGIGLGRRHAGAPGR